jgi:hypothetical protein
MAGLYADNGGGGGVKGVRGDAYTGSEDILVGCGVVVEVRCCERVSRRRWAVSGCGVVFVLGW